MAPERAGTPPRPYPSIALGVFEASPYEIATAYTIFANGGTIKSLRPISRLVTETIIVVTPLLQSEAPIARFEGRADNPDADFTWWTYSPAVYRELFAMLGFSIAKISHAKFYYMYGDRFEERATIVAVRS